MENERTLYKVLTAKMTGPFYHSQYELGKKYHCADFNEDAENDCSDGFYATELAGVAYSFSEAKRRRVFECVAWGKEVKFSVTKHRHENIKLIREIPYDELQELAKKEEEKLGYKLSEILFPAFRHPSDPIKNGRIEATDVDLAKKWIQLRSEIINNTNAGLPQSRYPFRFIDDCILHKIGETIYSEAISDFLTPIFKSIDYKVSNTKSDPYEVKIRDFARTCPKR